MPDFKQTFIPKKPLVQPRKETRRHVINPILLIGWVLFFGALTALGGLYLYRVLLEQKIESELEAVRLSIEEIDPILIQTLKQADANLKTIQALLDNHVAPSPLFAFLEESTLVSMRFKKIKLEVTPGEEASVNLPGEARDYASIALQSRVFAEESTFPDALFSDFQLNEKGNVEFDFDTNIAREKVQYKSTLGLGEPPENSNEPLPAQE